MEAARLSGALGAALVSLWAAVLTVFFASTQLAVDPATREAVHAPWWTMFQRGEWPLALGFLLASAGFGWLAWSLCRQAFRAGSWN